MEKILVTGATGRLGANLVKTLVERGYEVRVFAMADDSDLKKLKDIDCEIFTGNFLDIDSIDKAVKGCDRVLHIGCVMYRPSSMSELDYWNLNVTGTFALTRACIRNNVKRLVYASTDETYNAAANWIYNPIDERHRQRPTNLYGTHKKCGEEIVLGAYRETGLPVVVTRFASMMVADEILNFFNAQLVYDICKASTDREMLPNLNPQRLDRTWIPLEDVVRDPNNLCIPRGRDYRPWRMHISDVRDTIDGVLLAMTHDQAAGEVFHIGYSRAVTWDEVVRYIAEKTNRPVFDVCLDVYFDFELSTEKAQRILGFDPKYGPRAMIDDALRFRAGEDIGVIQGASYFD